jgi:hypothetical protein
MPLSRKARIYERNQGCMEILIENCVIRKKTTSSAGRRLEYTESKRNLLVVFRHSLLIPALQPSRYFSLALTRGDAASTYMSCKIQYQ